MTFVVIPQHVPSNNCKHLQTAQGCYWCCSYCDYNKHTCPGCGDDLTHINTNHDGTTHGCFEDLPC